MTNLGKKTLSMEERTVGYILQVPLYDGALCGSLASDRIAPFLDRTDDFQKLRSASHSLALFLREGPYQDVANRNPFLCASRSIPKYILERASKYGSLEQGLIHAVHGPYDLKEDEVKPDRVGSVSIARAFQYYHILADHLGIASDVRQHMQAYLDLFSKAVESMYLENERKGAPKIKPIPKGEEPYDNCPPRHRERRIAKTNKLYLATIDETLVLGNCLTGTNKLPILKQEDRGVIEILAKLSDDNLRHYIEKYGFIFQHDGSQFAA